ncbi:glycosyltransferase family 2 protein [Actinomadura graeca]|uniref:Glycosyltransferase family 2 protein n=1 Tax=Actinomadura graeca TaxID=2750812 RepID=A0ABX8QY30_9ACTN|nr:glycosyltransferase family 2 protein [Actinomadura graeca]QXJ22362.1 glycosyltransferase family 2 protein [Actinomadura graeca]
MKKRWGSQGFFFGDGPETRILDYPRYGLELAVAGARRRNPPIPPWLRRYARTWQSFGPARPCAGGPRPEEPLVYGLCQAWNEEDVIYATVRNMLLQGADRVFVIDDGSDDGTAAEAAAAGATVISDASDGLFDEVRRTERLVRVAEERTEEAGRPVWWVVVDADEFPRGPEGMTIADLARSLPPWVDTVGSRVLEHYPGRLSAPRPRHHPLDELPNAHWNTIRFCPAGHWKHQMLLVRGPGELRFTFGRHTIAAPPSRKPVLESEASLLMHHFPLRDMERTARKFRLANSASGRYGASSDTFVKERTEGRLRMLRLAYEERYDLLPNTFPGEPRTGASVRDWRELVPPSERDVRHVPGAPL